MDYRGQLWLWYHPLSPALFTLDFHHTLYDRSTALSTNRLLINTLQQGTQETAAMTLSSSPSSSPKISTPFLGLLAASASLPLVKAAEVTTDQLYARLTSTAAPAPGFNAEGGSVFTNFADLVNNGQFFFIDTAALVYEKPGSDPVKNGIYFDWCSDLTFSVDDNSSVIGYAGRCVDMFLDGYAEMMASGDQNTYDYSKGKYILTAGISGVFVEQLNVFEGQYHPDTDDWVSRFWDDGRKTMPAIFWEGHDEGDMSPNAATSSHSAFGEMTWMSVEEVAQLFNTSVDEFTPEKFKQVYLDTWIKDHEEEAAEKNPNAETELAIIEQVKNETNYVDGTAPTTPVESDGTADGSDAANPVVEDDSDSGSGRQLVSVAARFVSAALRVFGI